MKDSLEKARLILEQWRPETRFDWVLQISPDGSLIVHATDDPLIAVDVVVDWEVTDGFLERLTLVVETKLGRAEEEMERFVKETKARDKAEQLAAEVLASSFIPPNAGTDGAWFTNQGGLYVPDRN